MGLYIDVLNTAIEEAVKSTHHPRIGAVVFKGKRIFGTRRTGRFIRLGLEQTERLFYACCQSEQNRRVWYL